LKLSYFFEIRHYNAIINNNKEGIYA